MICLHKLNFLCICNNQYMKSIEMKLVKLVFLKGLRYLELLKER